MGSSLQPSTLPAKPCSDAAEEPSIQESPQKRNEIRANLARDMGQPGDAPALSRCAELE